MFDSPVSINAKDILIVPDVVGDETNYREVSKNENLICVTSPSEGSHGVWVFEDKLQELKANYPDLPVYGLWQFAIENKLVNYNKKYNVIATSARHGSWIEVDTTAKKVVASGLYKNFRISSRDDFEYSSCHKVELDLEGEGSDGYKLPSDQAWQPSELFERKRVQSIKSWAMTVGISVVIAVIGVVVDQMIKRNIELEKLLLEEKRTELISLEDQISIEASKKFMPEKNYREVVRRFQNVVLRSNDISTSHGTKREMFSLTGNTMVFYTSDADWEEYSNSDNDIKVFYLPTGKLRIEVNN